MKYEPQVIRTGALDMQVCVPDKWRDAKVKEFADTENLCGTENGWVIRKEGDRLLNGASERVQCSDHKGYVHIMLDA